MRVSSCGRLRALLGSAPANTWRYTASCPPVRVPADERVSTDLRQNLMKARLEKKLTQAQLAQQINELPKVVQDYEAGKAIPNQAIISKMERALGVKLRPAKK